MAPVRGPAVPRRRLGAELRRLREDAGLLIEQVAEQLECSTSKISRLETGKGIPKARDVRDMLAMYGVTDGKVRDRLLRWVRDGQQHGWWHGYSAVIDEKMEALVALEADAGSMRSYETTIIHGLLQTPDYMREVGKAVYADSSPADLDLFVELRRHRQEVLFREEGALDLHLVMEETALYRPVGGPKVFRNQLEHLLKAVRRENVRIQILPLSTGVHPAMGGSFALLSFPDDVDHGVVFAESARGVVTLEHAKDVATYAHVFDEISRRALDFDESVTFIASVL
ncbi:MAG: helix-turn-helix domain-containing protein [Candidatus Rokuibacteriota bacterium]